MVWVFHRLRASMSARRLTAEAERAGAKDLETLRQFCVAKTGRKVSMLPLHGGEGGARPTGMMIRGKSADYVLFDPRGGKWRTSLIVCHEFAHLLLNHGCTKSEVIDESMIKAWFPSLPMAMVKNALNRTEYDTFAEYSAEYLATKLLMLTIADDGQFARLRKSRLISGNDSIMNAYSFR